MFYIKYFINFYLNKIFYPSNFNFSKTENILGFGQNKFIWPKPNLYFALVKYILIYYLTNIFNKFIKIINLAKKKYFRE